MKGYIKLPEIKSMPDSRKLLRKLDDTEWKNYIFFHILHYYKTINNQEILDIINIETKKIKANIEREIKRHIRNWLMRKSPVFTEQGFKINLEPSSECNNEGFLDLKFEHSDWLRKYFSFEAKNLGKIKSQSQPASINEYVYNQTKKDGGMYRFFTGKYACEFNFGGMLGFVVGKNNNLKTKLIDKIETVYKNDIGQLTDNKIIINSIAENSNTFETIHKRKNFVSKKDEKFYLYHIILDFTNEEK